MNKILEKVVDAAKGVTAPMLQLIQKRPTFFVIAGTVLLSATLIPSPAHATWTECIQNLDLVNCLGTGALDVALSPVAFLSYLVFVFSNWFFWMVAALFNWSVIKLVFQFADFIGNSQSMLVAWSVLRDFGNIALLFGFIFLGIGTILNLHDFSAKKSLPALIIFAVLLNFSLFTAEAVIDTTNLLSSVMYKAACGQGANCGNTQDVLGAQINVGLAGAIVQNMHIGGAFEPGSGPDFWKYLDDPVKTTVFFLGLSIFSLAAAAVFLAGAILLISRGVILCFLMVTSPIGFAGMAIPPLHGIAKRWWDELICQSFFAPVYLLMIFVSLKLAENLNNTVCAGVGGACTSANLAEAVQGNDITTTGIFVIFGVVLAFLIGALLVAREFSCIIGSKGVVDTAFKFLGGSSGELTFGAWGMLGRNTFGRYANALSHSLPPDSARARAAKAVAGFSFDARKFVPGVSGFGGPGKAQEHGYHGVDEARRKELLEASKHLGGHEEEENEKLKYAVWQIDRDIRAAAAQNNTLLVNQLQAQKAAVNAQIASNQSTIEDRRANFADRVESNWRPFTDKGMRDRAAGDIRKDLRTPAHEKDIAKMLANLQNQNQNPPAQQPQANNPTPPTAATHPQAGGGGAHCWVAREVYGEQNPKWVEFRSWLHTKAPVWLWNLYGTYGERLAHWLRNKQILKHAIRILMDIAIKQRSFDIRAGKVYVDVKTI